MEEDFQLVSVVGFIQHNGGLYFRTISKSEYQFRATVLDYHLNPGGIAHGGFIMSIMDSGMGTAAHRAIGPNSRAATISLDMKFIASSTTGAILNGTAEVLQKTRSLVFVRGEILSGTRRIATAEGIWKIL